MNRTTAIIGAAAIALAAAVTITITDQDDSAAAVTRSRKLGKLVNVRLAEVPTAAGPAEIYLHAVGLCEERDEEGGLIRSEECEVNKPLAWFVAQGVLNKPQANAAETLWSGLKSNVAQKVPRRKPDGSEVIEDLR